MNQRLGDFLYPANATFKHEKAVQRQKANRLGIQIGQVYKLSTPRGFLIVQVLEFKRRKVVVKEVEDNRRFRVNPSNLSRYERPCP
jgi:hypothetical protein